MWGVIISGLVVVAGVAIFLLVKSNTPKPIVSPLVSPKNDAVILPVGTPVPVEVSPTASPTAENTATTKEFTVTASNFKYDVKTIKVKKGDTVKILFKNSEGFHDFVIDEFDVATNQIGAEEEDEVEFVVDKAGTFEYYCSVGQHRKNGMVGKLVVE